MAWGEESAFAGHLLRFAYLQSYLVQATLVSLVPVRALVADGGGLAGFWLVHG